MPPLQATAQPVTPSVSLEGASGHGRPRGCGCSELPRLCPPRPRERRPGHPVLRPSTPGAAHISASPLTHRHEQACSPCPASSSVSRSWPSCSQPLKMRRQKPRAAQCTRTALAPTSAERPHFHTPSLRSVTFFSFWGAPAPWMSGPFPYRLLGFLLCPVEEREQILLASCGPHARKGVIWTDPCECLLLSRAGAPSEAVICDCPVSVGMVTP